MTATEPIVLTPERLGRSVNAMAQTAVRMAFDMAICEIKDAVERLSDEPLTDADLATLQAAVNVRAWVFTCATSVLAGVQSLLLENDGAAIKAVWASECDHLMADLAEIHTDTVKSERQALWDREKAARREKARIRAATDKARESNFLPFT